MTISVDAQVKSLFKALCALERVSLSAKINDLMDAAVKAANGGEGDG